MKALILCAGKSTRTQPLTITRSKVLLKVGNKEIIKHTLDNLIGIVDEAILVIGYKKEMIIKSLGNEYNGLKISYIEQKEQLGTGHAVAIAKNFIKDDFILIGGDDLFSKQDFKNVSKEEFAVIAQKVEDPSHYGVLVEQNSFLKEIVEKPKTFVSDLVSTGCYKLTPKIFDYINNLKETSRGELEFVDAIAELMKTEKIKIIKTDDWVPISYAWNLLDANEKVLSNIKRKIDGVVEDHVTIKGEVIIGKGTTILSGAYIEGPVIIGENCKIGPNCYIRPSTSIGDNCHVGNGVEVKNIILGDNSNVPHLNYVGDSVIGENCNLGAGTIVANLRHNNKNMRTVIKDELVDTGRRKFGMIMADGVKTSINTSIYPGRKFWPNTSTKPGEIVDKDKTK